MTWSMNLAFIKRVVRPNQGGGFLGRLIKGIARFISRWTGTKQQLQKILDRQASMQNTLEGSDGQDR